MSVHEATQMCLAALPTGVTPIVRIASHALDEATPPMGQVTSGRNFASLVDLTLAASGTRFAATNLVELVCKPSIFFQLSNASLERFGGRLTTD